MIRQRNIHQVKEHNKCPPNQTKEEEIGNLSEKEFRIMIAKMIQNLENKIELQINCLETRRGVKRRDTYLANNQFPECSPQLGIHKEIHRVGQRKEGVGRR